MYLYGMINFSSQFQFCGNTIAGLSLLSTAVMRLTHDEDESKRADILLSRRSLYIMRYIH